MQCELLAVIGNRFGQSLTFYKVTLDDSTHFVQAVMRSVTDDSSQQLMCSFQTDTTFEALLDAVDNLKGGD